MKRTLRVELNGTDVNPYLIQGLTQNPFPQIASFETTRMCLRLQKLGGSPIPHDKYRDYIETVLIGWSEEFINLCIARFVPGEYVVFDVTWDQ